MNIKDYLTQEVPLNIGTYQLPKNVGLVVVDEVNGFCTPGAGNLAPPTQEAADANGVTRMVKETEALLKSFKEANQPVMFFQDNHTPGKIEAPYPPHCEEGTGEEELVNVLQPYAENAVVYKNGVFDPVSSATSFGQTTVLKKDCINGFVGAINNETGENVIVDWVNQNKLEAVVVVGICTSICVMQFVQTLVSARNHNLMSTLKDVVVYEKGASDYNLPKDVAVNIGLPEFTAHPQELVEYMGFYFMASAGAILSNKLV